MESQRATDFRLNEYWRKSINVLRKKRGRPATGQDPILGMRLPVGLRNRVDEWAQQQDNRPSRSEAIRRLLNLALDSEGPIKEAGPPLKVTSGMKNDRKAILAPKRIAGFQIRAARAVLGWNAEDLARQSSVSLRTIRRAEISDAHTSMTVANEQAIRRALEAAGVEFIDENGGGPGVRLRTPQAKRA